MTDPGLLVLGAGGHSKVAVAALQAAGLRVRVILDDDPDTWGRRVLDIPVEGPIRDVAADLPRRALVAIGDNRLRRVLAERLAYDWITAIHPTAWVAPDCVVGAGSLICAGAVLQPGVEVGEHAVVNTGARIDHDARIGAFAHVAPGATLAGDVEVGEGALVGAGSTVLPGVSLGAWSVLGAGSVARENLAPGGRAAGVPARPLDGE